MKNIILSADGDQLVYSVPDVVADNLEKYCLEFCNKWIQTDPHAEKYRFHGLICYDERDFIDYLNQWRFPSEPSVYITNLGPIDSDLPIPEKYKDCPSFNF